VKRVLIVDDSSLLRNGLKRIIFAIPDLILCGEAPDFETAVSLINKLMPDILILDIDLSPGSGIDVLNSIKESDSKPVIVVFTNYSQEAYRNKMAELGATYFFDKSSDIDKLIDVLKKLSESN